MGAVDRASRAAEERSGVGAPRSTLSAHDWRDVAVRRPKTARPRWAGVPRLGGDDTTRTPPSWLPLAAVATTLVFWASAFVAIRYLGDASRPGRCRSAGWSSARSASAWWRWPAASPGPRAAQWRSIVLIGVLWFGVYNVALNEGEQRVDAGTAAMLIQVSPILIAVLAAVFLDERFTRYLVIGLALAFGGVALIAVSTSPGGDRDVIGVALCLLVGGRLRREPGPPEAARGQPARRPRDLARLLGRHDRVPAVRGLSSGRSCRTRPPPRSGGWSTSASSRRRSPSRRTPTRCAT